MPVYRVPVKEFVTQIVLEHTTAAKQARLFPAVCLRVRNPTALLPQHSEAPFLSLPTFSPTESASHGVC